MHERIQNIPYLEFAILSLRFDVERFGLTFDQAVTQGHEYIKNFLLRDYFDNEGKNNYPNDFIPIRQKYVAFKDAIFNEIIRLYSPKISEQKITAELQKLWDNDPDLKKIDEHILANEHYQNEARASIDKNRIIRDQLGQALRLHKDFLGNFKELIIDRYLAYEAGAFIISKDGVASSDQSVEHYLGSVFTTISMHLSMSEMAATKNKNTGFTEEHAHQALEILFDSLPDFFSKQYPDNQIGDQVWKHFVERAIRIWDESTLAPLSDWTPNFILQNR